MLFPWLAEYWLIIGDAAMIERQSYDEVVNNEF